jgi:DNA-binding transcriptional MerR regulator
MNENETTATPREHGYRGVVACQAAGISYRQLDYWARTGLVVPSIRSASGSGSARLYSFTDILVLKIIRRFLDAGVSLQNIRTAVEHLTAKGVASLEQVTLMSDGVSIYECSSSEEVYDLLQGGQGVFGIAIGKVLSEVEGTLVTLERDSAGSDSDELAARRRAKEADVKAV